MYTSKKISAADTLANENLQRQISASDNVPADITIGDIDAILTSKGVQLLGDAHTTVTRSEARYRHLINRMKALVVEHTPTGEILYTNQAITLITGFSAEELCGCNWLAWVLPVHESTCQDQLRQQFIDSNELIDFRTSIRTADGSRKVISWNSANVLNVDSLVERIICFGVDITKHVRAEQELSIAGIAFESQEGMIVTDAKGTILRVNNAFTSITGYTAEEVIGKNPRILKSGRQSADFYASMWAVINNNGTWSGEVWNLRKNGECYPERLSITAVIGSDGIVSHYVGTLADITMSKAAAEKIKHLAFYDPLTDLPNRLLLRDRLKLALVSSRRSGRKGALLFIDMDDFKTLNDSFGHDIGDLLLQQIARRLESCVREGDTVARLGGDEFVVMLEDLNEQAFEAVTQTELIGNKILVAFNQPYQLAMHYYHCTPSIGAILFTDHGHSVDELIKQADIAMYQAKAAGRNALRFFDPQMQVIIDARVAMEADLRLALEKNQFELYYQPQVNHDHQIIGAEVLIRWQHPQRGFIPPADFIPLAEGTGLILPIGQWVLETACTQIKSWENHSSARHLQLAVNVSARQFHQLDFVEQVTLALHNAAIDPKKLKMELTESLVLDNIDETIIKMNALQEIGVSFSMDDFGTGFSSLAYLTELPLNQLKIDQSFVRNIGVRPTNAVIVQTIIGMADNLSMEVIAEGVETEEQRAFLELHGCPVIQGYLFSKPVPLEQFEALLKQGQLQASGLGQ
jgi:diguanylate cyclase (GGDEF)-like protein/PAS domain S-box-containing protein